MSINLTAQNIIAKVDNEGNRHMLLDSIIDMRTNGQQALKKDSLVILKSSNKRRVERAVGWEVLM